MREYRGDSDSRAARIPALSQKIEKGRRNTPPSSPRPGFASSPFTAFLPQLPQLPQPLEPFGIAGGGRILPLLDFGPPAPPPVPFLELVNADWDRNHTDLPPKNTRVGFAGPDGERIPAGARMPPTQPPPSWNGTHNSELSDMVAANYDTVRVEKREQRQCFNDIVANPTSYTATKRRELREELARIDRDPNSQHLGQTAREDLAKLGLSHPHLVDDEWLLPTRLPSPSTPQPPQSPLAG